ncbi:MAG: response regulator [Lachnospiraceae bacterium]|nr:response regulator [Lachnospiraceae bacterium]
MDRLSRDRFVILALSVMTICISVNSYILGWEFWVPPLFVIGIIIMWIMHISQRMGIIHREEFYLSFSMILILFQGVHTGSIFEISLSTVVLLAVFAAFNRVFMINLIIAEYILLIMTQIILSVINNDIEFSVAIISRILFHIIMVLCVFMYCRLGIFKRKDQQEEIRIKSDAIKKSDEDMEDFLSNISHELRTPVNVVNGMTTLLLKKHEKDQELCAIRDAGARLSFQIEDIQDYTEVKRNQLVLENESYMTISLINDVVQSYKLHTQSKDIDLIVDLDPNVPNTMIGDIKKIHKIFRLLIDNALKFSIKGGIYVKITAPVRDYGVNLSIQVTDTGIGMSRKDIASVSKGFYQANKKRNRSTGGVGLGLPMIYGFAHRMGGFVKIESIKGRGTTVNVTIPQKVSDSSSCLDIDREGLSSVLFYVMPEKYSVPELRDFYRSMAINLATGLNIPLYQATNRKELERYIEKIRISHIFMGQEEYQRDSDYIDALADDGVVVGVSAYSDFKLNPNSKAHLVSKPFYAYSAVKLINGDTGNNATDEKEFKKPVFNGVHALVVDDERMNLVVATGLFKQYKMIVDTASSGMEAIEKYQNNRYDIVFMDHMMPGMDGVEAMKRIKGLKLSNGQNPRVVALTANAISGAREMFLKEGFDGFISKPIDISDFERVVKRVLPRDMVSYEGGERS